MARTYPDELKATVIAEAMAGQETLAAVARRHGVPPRTLKGWRDAWLRSEGRVAAMAPVLAHRHEMHQRFLATVEESALAVIEARTEQLRHCSTPEWLNRQAPAALVEWNHSMNGWLGHLLKLLSMAPYETLATVLFIGQQPASGGDGPAPQQEPED